MDEIVREGGWLSETMTNLEQMRKFYRAYSSDEIPQKLSEEFGSNLASRYKTVLPSEEELKGLMAEVAKYEQR